MSDYLKKLEKARDRDFISEISFQFCEFLKRIEPDCPPEVLLAACLASERKEQGDVCVELQNEAGKLLFEEGRESGIGIEAPDPDTWAAACRASTSVGNPGEQKPLILDAAHRLYLQKYWKYERELADRLLEMVSREEEILDLKWAGERLDSLFKDETPGEGPDRQKLAVFTALLQNLTVISGGPGTGKTTTVAKILVLLAETGNYNHMVLAAPTGKAAARLKESVLQELEKLEKDVPGFRKRGTSNSPIQIPDEAFTVHKLLGARKYSSDFRYGSDNPLPYDVVVVDEVSMVDLAMMYRLAGALPKQAKLILLGDKDQLASVEAGAVLASICNYATNRFSEDFISRAGEVGLTVPDSSREPSPKPLTDHIVLLEKSYRFGRESGIGHLAAAILSGNPKESLEILEDNTYPDIALKSYENPSGLGEILMDFLNGYSEALEKISDIADALRLISRFGLLCVHRRGPLGSEQINHLAEHLMRENGLIPAASEWYAGKPVMATRNDYSLGLRNGDLGITLRDDQGGLKVFFKKNEEEHLSFYPSRLSYVETAYAITVHKSQGSEFDNVAVFLPGKTSPVSTKELLYTAVTRARNSCTIVGSRQVFRESISQKAARSSGLREHLWGG